VGFSGTGMIESQNTATPSTGIGATSLQSMQDMLDEISDVVPPITDFDSRRGPGIDDLKKLLEISQAVNATLDLEDILKMVMMYAIALVDAERGFIITLKDGEPSMRQSHNLAPEHFGQNGDRISRTIVSRVMQSGESVYTSDAQEDERFAARQSVHDLHLRSIMAVPLKNGSNVEGVIYLDNSSEARIFLQADLYILELLAQQASIAMTNASLINDVRQLQAYSENIVASTPVALLVLDARGMIRHSNERGSRILSALGGQDSDHSRWLDVVDGQQRGAWATLFRNVLDSGNAHSWSSHALRIGEDLRSYRVLVSPLRESRAEPEGLVLTLDDITEAEQMSEELARASFSIEKAEAIGDIAHEMNNYLMVMMSQVEMGLMDLGTNNFENMEHRLNRSMQATETLSRLVEGLLRPDRMDPKPQSFALSTAMDWLEATVAAERKFGATTFEYDIEQDLPWVTFDPVHIELILYNLCKNSVEAMTDAKSNPSIVRIRATREGEFVRIHLCDSGPGLDKKVSNNPWKLGQTTKATGHGRGLHNIMLFV
jgi:signal transduction histidine kinase